MLEDSALDEINMIDAWLKNQKHFDNNKLMSKKINKGIKRFFMVLLEQVKLFLLL